LFDVIVLNVHAQTDDENKGKVILPQCLTKYYALKTYPELHQHSRCNKNNFYGKVKRVFDLFPK